MSPAERPLAIGRTSLRKADAGLVVPGRAFEAAIFIERFVDDIAREDLADIVLHHTRDVPPQQLRHLVGTKVTFGEPFGIVMIANQTVAPNLHAVYLREGDALIAWPKTEAFALLRLTTSSRPRVQPC